jgi:dephospho-CoA kinase
VKIYGLTGGIASGKSSVARTLRALGATVIDADELARYVVEPGRPAYDEIKAHWPETIGADGVLDRKKLGDIVFGDASARAQLNAITHPRIAEETARRTEEAASRGEPLVFYEAALLVENGLAEAFDGLIVVTVSEETQLARLRARDEIGEAPARARIASQLPLSAKAKQATWIIDNNGSAENTRLAAQNLYRELLASAQASTQG